MSEEESRDEHTPDTQGGLGRRVLRGAGISAGGYFLTQLLTLVSFLVLARLATPDDFGDLAAGSILVSVGLLFTESGMLAAIVHRADRIEAAAATAMISTLLAGLAFSLLAFVLAPVVGSFFESERIAAVAAAMSGVLLLRTIPVVPTALLQRRLSFVRRTIVEPIGAVGFGVAAVIATSSGLGVWGLVIGYYAQAAIDVVLSWGLAGWRPRLRLASFAVWRELVGYGRHIFASNVITRAADEAPTVFLGRFVGAASLGQFRYAIRIASTPFAAMLAAGSYVVFPAMARIAGDPERFRGAFMRSLKWMTAIGMPAGLILLPLGPALAKVVFGEVWIPAGEAAAALCLLPALGAVESATAEALKAIGKPRLLVHIHIVQGIVGAIAMAALLPFGLVGVAAGVSVGVAVGALYAAHLVRPVVGVSYRQMAAACMPAVLASLVMVAALFALDRLLLEAASKDTFDAIIALLVEALAGGFIYIATLRLIARDFTVEVVGMLRSARR